MEEQENKYLDKLSKKVIKKAVIESPTFNFTDAVMSKVNTLQESEVTVYKPLISKTAWFLIVLGIFATVLSILFFGSETESSNWINTLDFSALSNINFDVIPRLSLSKTFTYSILFLGIMVFIQIPLLKNHFDKRFE